MSDILAPALVAGFFALLGAYLGAALTRRTEYEKWLRQERTEAFAVLLREIHDTRLYAGKAFYEGPGTELEKSTRVTEMFTHLQKPVSLARMFMSSPGRNELSTHVNDLWVNCTVQGGPANRANQIEDLLLAIQVVLERELDYMPWKVRWPFS